MRSQATAGGPGIVQGSCRPVLRPSRAFGSSPCPSKPQVSHVRVQARRPRAASVELAPAAQEPADIEVDSVLEHELTRNGARPGPAGPWPACAVVLPIMQHFGMGPGPWERGQAAGAARGGQPAHSSRARLPPWTRSPPGPHSSRIPPTNPPTPQIHPNQASVPRGGQS